MARLHVEVLMLDDAGDVVLGHTIDEPTRLDHTRDPLYVVGRLGALTERAIDEVHRQALTVEQTSRATSRGAS